MRVDHSTRVLPFNSTSCITAQQSVVVIFEKISKNVNGGSQLFRLTTFIHDHLRCKHKHSRILNNMIKSCKDKISVEYKSALFKRHSDFDTLCMFVIQNS